MKMRRITLPFIVLASMLIFSCKQERLMPKLGKVQTESLRTLSFRGVTTVSTPRGFTIDANYDGSKNIGKINFSNTKWDTGSIKVILFVKNTTNSNIVWAKQLETGEYWYNGGAKPSISFKTDIKYYQSSINDEKLFVYVFDNSLNCQCEEKSTGDYNVKIEFPSLTKNSDNTYTLKPANEQDQNIIFSTSVELQKILDDTSNPKQQTKLADVKPVGTLILFSLKNTSTTKEYMIENNYKLRLQTNGFSFENVNIDCASGDVSHNPIYNSYTESDDRNSYAKGSDNKIDYNNVLTDAPKLDYTDIKLASSDGSDVNIPANSRSAIYALYVMPTTKKTITGYGTEYNMLKVTHPDILKSSPNDDEPENTEAYLFNSQKLIDFYSLSGKSTSLTINVPGVIVGDIRYNALAYSGYYNVAEDKQSFNKEQLNNTLDHNYDAMLNFDEAQALFNNPLPEFLKGYHMPAVGDWNSIIPKDDKLIYFNQPTSFDYSSETTSTENQFRVGGVQFDNVISFYRNKKQSETNYVCYAIRFTAITRKTDNKRLEEGNCPYLSVWRYAYIDNPTGGKMLEVYCCVLPKNYKFNKEGGDITINDGYNDPESIMNEDFFKNRLGIGAIRRLFPATGCITGGQNIANWSVGQGYFWTSDEIDTTEANDVYFGNDKAHSSKDSKEYKYSIRPFLDDPRY